MTIMNCSDYNAGQSGRKHGEGDALRNAGRAGPHKTIKHEGWAGCRQR